MVIEANIYNTMGNKCINTNVRRILGSLPPTASFSTGGEIKIKIIRIRRRSATIALKLQASSMPIAIRVIFCGDVAVRNGLVLQ